MELKAIRGGDIHAAVEFRRPANGEYPEDTDYYLKSEADKVIKELKAQKAQAEDDCAYWKAKVQRERHHKFKRCLDKAKWCKAELEILMMWWCNAEPGMLVSTWEFKIEHYKKWHKRGLELAEQFNPNSTAPKENNNG